MTDRDLPTGLGWTSLPRYAVYEGANTDVYETVGAVSALITDPPYGDEVHAQTRMSRDKEGRVAVQPIPFAALTATDAQAMANYAAANVKGWALICSQPEQIEAWRSFARNATSDTRSMKYFRAMIWVKPDARPNFSGNGPGVGYETIQSYWCGGGKSTWNGGGKTGVFTHIKRHTGSHPTEKPLTLMRELITLFTNPGDVVFDPFMGSGSTGVACLELGRRFIGCEKDPTYFQTALGRLADAAQVIGLFHGPKAKSASLFEGESAYARTKKEVGNA
jgi:site-specific DNA-methyltransferase (adenine-specific)